MKAGIVILPEYRWPEAEPKWRRAEEYGFDHVWTFDHLGWRSLVDGPWFGAVPTLALAARATGEIELGTLVASPNFRHPVPFAREILALDDISGGRFTLGVGAGGSGDYDMTVLGVDGKVTNRVRRFAEFVEFLDTLLTSERSTLTGEFYSAVDARNAPGPVQTPRPPFVVAANGPKAMRIAAHFGQGWITTGTSCDDLDTWWRSIAEAASRFDEALRAAGRDGRAVRRFVQTDAAPVYSMSSVETYRDFVGRAAELGFTDVVAPWPRDEGIFAGSEKVLDAVAVEVLPRMPSAAC